MIEKKVDPQANPAADGTKEGESPAASTDARPPRAPRVPMHSVRQKLQVPELPGYRLYWFLESNVPQALQAWYEFVKASEVTVNQFNPASDDSVSGNIDLGDRVKLYAGPDSANRPEYFILMKLKKELANEDAREIAKRNAAILEGVFKREQILGTDNAEEGADLTQRYVRPDMTRAHIPLFQRPVKKV